MPPAPPHAACPITCRLPHHMPPAPSHAAGPTTCHRPHHNPRVTPRIDSTPVVSTRPCKCSGVLLFSKHAACHAPALHVATQAFTHALTYPFSPSYAAAFASSSVRGLRLAVLDMLAQGCLTLTLRLAMLDMLAQGWLGFGLGSCNG